MGKQTAFIGVALLLLVSACGGGDYGGKGKWGGNGEEVERKDPLVEVVPARRDNISEFERSTGRIEAHTLADVYAQISEVANDVLVDGRKVSGILLERSQTAGGSQGENAALVAGFGVNCISHPVDTPFPATDLAHEGFAIDAGAVFEQLLSCFQRELAAWDTGAGFGAIRDAWLARAGGIGEEIRVTLPNGEEVRGIFDSIDNDGNLIVHVGEWTRKRISAGDVFFVARGDVPERGE